MIQHALKEHSSQVTGVYDVTILDGSIHTMKKNTEADIAMINERDVFKLQYY